MKSGAAILVLGLVCAAANAQKPGCAVAVSRDGEVVASNATGMANLEYDIPNTVDTIFETGSVAKQFTAAALVLLEQQGKLSLDDELRKYLPELPEYAKGVTIRQGLSHTAGLRDWGTIFDLAGWPRGTKLYTLPLVLDVMTKQRALNFPPGTQYSYSNSGYTLGAMIVERVSGKSLPEFTREAFFIPFGMEHTSWRDDYERIVKKRATAYSPERGVYRADMHPENVYGHCCVLTTVGDLLRWSDRLAAGPLAPTMEKPAVLKNGNAIEYGLGLSVRNWRGTREVAHSGATAGYRAYLARYPEKKLSVAALCNDGTANATMVARDALKEFFDPPAENVTPATLTAEQISSRAGLYRNFQNDAVLRIFVREGKLRAGFESGAELIPLSDNRFRIGPVGNELTFSDEGVTLSSFGYHYRCGRVADAKDVRLADYAGDYWSDEVGVLYRVRVRMNRLEIQLPPAEANALEPTYADAFRIGDSALVRFTRDASGKVNGFDAKNDFGMLSGTARVERIHFTRRF